MEQTAKTFVKALSEIYDACCYINDMGACSGCPVKYNCFDETSLSQIAEEIPIGAFADLLYFAEDVESRANEQDFDDYHEWLNAETERELWED